MTNQSTALVRAEAILPPAPIEFNNEQLDLIKTTIAKGATDLELSLFVETCRRTGLDPFLKQIYAIKRYSSQEKKEVMGIQVGIDGLRLIAERTGRYGGQDPIEWLDEDGVWSTVWTGAGDYPVAARVTIYRTDSPRGFPAVARWDSYAQTFGNPPVLGQMWKKMPDVMIGKCAESLALRRAFPAEMSGLAAAIDSEYDPAVEAQEQERAAPPTESLGEKIIEGEVIDAKPEAPADLPQGKYDDTIGSFWAITREELGMTRDEVMAECEKRYPGREPMDLKPNQELSALLTALRAMKATEPKQAALPT